MFKKLSVFLIALLVILISVFCGYIYRDGKAETEAKLAVYDNLFIVLTSNLIISDAIASGKYKVAKNLTTSNVQWQLSKMIDLYENNDFKSKNHEYLRCIITKKIRKMYLEQRIFIDEKELLKINYPIKQVQEYLRSNCEGESSHDNWSDVRESKESLSVMESTESE